MRNEKHLWQIQEAKQRFSELVRFANNEGPQLVTNRGEACAWVVSDKDYQKLLHARENIIDFFQRSPHRDIEIPIERRKDLPRKVDL